MLFRRKEEVVTEMGAVISDVQRTLNSRPVPPVIGQLRAVCAHRMLPELHDELDHLGTGLEGDLLRIEAGLAETAPGAGPVEHSAKHLLALGGKRLRPLLVLLAARLGRNTCSIEVRRAAGAPDASQPPQVTPLEAARELAIAVELVHTATLLHDDVVDLGETRRGSETSRLLYGNAASIFAGDWLLVEALRRVCVAKVPEVLDRLLQVIEEMILAESVQLARRGSTPSKTDREAYFRIVEGKTASLFGFAMFAGGRAAGKTPRELRALEGYGRHLGVAFQVIDDVLDLSGDANAVKKTLFADLREGKMTYPLIVALERDQTGELASILAEVAADENAVPDRARVSTLLFETGALVATHQLAKERARLARESLLPLDQSAERGVLEAVVDAAVERSF